jgi:hypothetical protein
VATSAADKLAAENAIGKVFSNCFDQFLIISAIDNDTPVNSTIPGSSTAAEEAASSKLPCCTIAPRRRR